MPAAVMALQHLGSQKSSDLRWSKISTGVDPRGTNQRDNNDASRIQQITHPKHRWQQPMIWTADRSHRTNWGRPDHETIDKNRSRSKPPTMRIAFDKRRNNAMLISAITTTKREGWARWLKTNWDAFSLCKWSDNRRGPIQCSFIQRKHLKQKNEERKVTQCGQLQVSVKYQQGRSEKVARSSINRTRQESGACQWDEYYDSIIAKT